MLRILSLNILLLASLASAVVLPPLKRQDGDISIDGVDINFSVCDDINPKTGNKMSKDIVNAWDDAIKLANAIKEIDTNTDIGSFDYFGPNMQTEGMGYKILSVYNNLGSFGRNFLWGWRVNAFCPSQDQELWASCGEGVFAFQWDTLCKDGRCPCKERDGNGKCKFVDKENWINRDPENSYINVQFCGGFFSTDTLDEVVDKGKGASKEEKYNINTYWHNRGKILFHELLHAATVGTHANDKLMISDLKIQIRNEDKPDELKQVDAYGPLNAKMLARTIRNENFHHVRQNDDNWSAYALSKYIQDKVGVYPILPLADGHVYGDNAEKPKALFLIKGDQTLVNQDIYNSDTLASGSLMERLDGESYTVDDFTFRSDSDYPQWYIEALQKARSGDLDGNGNPSSEPPQDTPQEPPAPPRAGKTVQVFWEEEPIPGLVDPTAPVWRGDSKYWWYFYVGDAGQGSDPCNSDPIDTHFEAPAGDSWPVVIDGEWELEIPDLGKCKFQGIGRVGDSGDNGWLHCPDRAAIKCVPDERPVDQCRSDTTIQSKSISYCDF